MEINQGQWDVKNNPEWQITYYRPILLVSSTSYLQNIWKDNLHSDDFLHNCFCSSQNGFRTELSTEYALWR